MVRLVLGPRGLRCAGVRLCAEWRRPCTFRSSPPIRLVRPGFAY